MLMGKPDKFINIALTKENIDLYYQRTSIINAIKKVLPYLKGDLLDTGCGAMPYREYILKHSEVENYVGLDIASALNYSDEIKPDITWDGRTMPIEENTFQSAMATEVLEHVPEPANFLSEVYRVLRPGGIFFFTVPFLWPLHEVPHDEYRYTPYALKRLLETNKFKYIEISPLGGWHASMAQMLGLWIRRGPLGHRKRKLLSLLLFPVYKYLIKKDVKTLSDSKMVTGISGYCYK